MREETEARLRAEVEAERAAAGVRSDEPLPEPLSVDAYRGGDWERERDRLFRRIWLPVCRDEDLPETGRWIARTLHGHEIAVLRGPDGIVARRNRCVHRGAVVLRGPSGHAPDGFACPYHGIRYALDGRVCGVPESASHHPDLGTDALPSLPAASWAGFVFVALEPDPPPFDVFLPSDLREELDAWDWPELVRVDRREWEGAFDWKLGVEAFVEPLHGPFLHPRTVAPFVNHRASGMRRFGDHSRMALAYRDPRLYGPDGLLGRAAAARGVRPGPRLNGLQREATFVTLVFPGLVTNHLPHHTTTIAFEPLGPRRTRVVLELFAPPADTDDQRAFYASLWPGHVRLVEEDVENLAWVQRGLDDPTAPPIRLSRYERQLAWFREAVGRWLS